MLGGQNRSTEIYEWVNNDWCHIKLVIDFSLYVSEIFF